jgi:glycosyltransferase involved in cell wall biosynthesis
MRIGIAGPISLSLLLFDGKGPDHLPGCADAPIIASIVNGLVRRGHQVVVYTTSPVITEPYVYSTGNPAICVAPGRTTHRSRDLYRVERAGLVDLMRSHPVDIINAEWSYDYAWAALDTRVPTLVTAHDHARTIFMHSPDAFRLVRLAISGYVLHRAQHISANSEYLQGRLTPSQRRKTRVIPNFFAPSLEVFSRESARRWVGSDRPVIATVVNGFGRRKNVGAALHAFSLLQRTLPEVELHLIGEGMGEGGPAHEYAGSAGLTPGVRFVGQLPYNETLREIASAAVLLHPALEESFGMTGLEAMVVGTPVIAGRDSGNMPFLLDHGNAGVLCDVRSPQAIAAALLDVLTDQARAAKIVQCAGEIARSMYSEDKVISAYVDYYRDILELDGR